AVSQLKNPSYNYPSALAADTLYYPTLIAINWAGCRDTTNSNIKVFPGPSASFVADQAEGCGPHSVQFTNTSKTNNHLPFNSLSSIWISSNRDTAYTPNFNSTFISSLTKDTFHSVVLRVSSANACSHSDTMQIRVFPLPSVDFDIDVPNGCEIL